MLTLPQFFKELGYIKDMFITKPCGVELFITPDILPEVLVYKGDICSISVFKNHSSTILNDGRVVYCCGQTLS